RRADTVALGLPPTAGEDDFRTKLATLNILAGDRFDDIELNVNLAAVGEPPPWLARLGLDPAKASDNAAMAVLSGSPQEIADLLRRRRDDLGISYVTVNAAYADALAPVVERLTGT
ncbi:MAG: LLM class flavin-dependent oxidoreductase, partial [Streptosporangiales bacterium]|nr:LLM class flavin-dependent oxidoreductase [Streptosporangiales bacterium]